MPPDDTAVRKIAGIVKPHFRKSIPTSDATHADWEAEALASVNEALSAGQNNIIALISASIQALQSAQRVKRNLDELLVSVKEQAESSIAPISSAVEDANNGSASAAAMFALVTGSTNDSEMVERVEPTLARSSVQTIDDVTAQTSTKADASETDPAALLQKRINRIKRTIAATQSLIQNLQRINATPVPTVDSGPDVESALAKHARLVRECVEDTVYDFASDAARPLSESGSAHSETDDKIEVTSVFHFSDTRPVTDLRNLSSIVPHTYEAQRFVPDSPGCEKLEQPELVKIFNWYDDEVTQLLLFAWKNLNDYFVASSELMHKDHVDCKQSFWLPRAQELIQKLTDLQAQRCSLKPNGTSQYAQDTIALILDKAIQDTYFPIERCIVDGEASNIEIQKFDQYVKPVFRKAAEMKAKKVLDALRVAITHYQKLKQDRIPKYILEYILLRVRALEKGHFAEAEILKKADEQNPVDPCEYLHAVLTFVEAVATYAKDKKADKLVNLARPIRFYMHHIPLEKQAKYWQDMSAYQNYWKDGSRDEAKPVPSREPKEPINRPFTPGEQECIDAYKKELGQVTFQQVRDLDVNFILQKLEQEAMHVKQSRVPVSAQQRIRRLEEQLQAKKTKLVTVVRLLVEKYQQLPKQCQHHSKLIDYFRAYLDMQEVHLQNALDKTPSEQQRILIEYYDKFESLLGSFCYYLYSPEMRALRKQQEDPFARWLFRYVYGLKSSESYNQHEAARAQSTTDNYEHTMLGSLFPAQVRDHQWGREFFQLPKEKPAISLLAVRLRIKAAVTCRVTANERNSCRDWQAQPNRVNASSIRSSSQLQFERKKMLDEHNAHEVIARLNNGMQCLFAHTFPPGASPDNEIKYFSAYRDYLQARYDDMPEQHLCELRVLIRGLALHIGHGNATKYKEFMELFDLINDEHVGCFDTTKLDADRRLNRATRASSTALMEALTSPTKSAAPRRTRSGSVSNRAASASHHLIKQNSTELYGEGYNAKIKACSAQFKVVATDAGRTFALAKLSIQQAMYTYTMLQSHGGRDSEAVFVKRLLLGCSELCRQITIFQNQGVKVKHLDRLNSFVNKIFALDKINYQSLDDMLEKVDCQPADLYAAIEGLYNAYNPFQSLESIQSQQWKSLDQREHTIWVLLTSLRNAMWDYLIQQYSDNEVSAVPQQRTAQPNTQQGQSSISYRLTAAHCHDQVTYAAYDEQIARCIKDYATDIFGVRGARAYAECAKEFQGQDADSSVSCTIC